MKFDKISFKQILLIITFTVVLIFCCFNISFIFGILGKVVSVLMPFIVGLCMAFVVNELLKPLERYWDKIASLVRVKRAKKPKKEIKNKFLKKLSFKKAGADIAKVLKRPVCLILSILIVLGVIAIVLLIVIPSLADTIMGIVSQLEGYFNQIEKWYSELVAFLSANTDFDLSRLNIDFDKILTSITSSLTDMVSGFVSNTITVGSSIVTTILDIFIGFVFAIYFLSSKEKIGTQVHRILGFVIPEKRISSFNHILEVTSSTFSRFVVGQITEAVIIGLLCALGMLIFGFPHVGTISLLIGVTALIPIFGAFIGTGVGAFLILFVDPIKAVWFIVFILVLQQLEGNLIYPKVVGSKLGLPGILVLVAVTVGGGLFDFVGMLVGVPICAVVYTLVKEYLDKKDEEKAAD